MSRSDGRKKKKYITTKAGRSVEKKKCSLLKMYIFHLNKRIFHGLC